MRRKEACFTLGPRMMRKEAPEEPPLPVSLLVDIPSSMPETPVKQA